jgi:hypothetical protein
MFLFNSHSSDGRDSQDLKTQLSEERDAVRRLGLQKEIETKELQTRIDKMVSFIIPLTTRIMEWYAITERRVLQDPRIPD